MYLPTLQWYEAEAERHLVLHKARFVHQQALISGRDTGAPRPHGQCVARVLSRPTLVLEGPRDGRKETRHCVFRKRTRSSRDGPMEQGTGVRSRRRAKLRGQAGQRDQGGEEAHLETPIVPTDTRCGALLARKGDAGLARRVLVCNIDTVPWSKDDLSLAADEEERRAVIEFVVDGLNRELYRELAEGLQLGQPALAIAR